MLAAAAHETYRQLQQTRKRAKPASDPASAGGNPQRKQRTKEQKKYQRQHHQSKVPAAPKLPKPKQEKGVKHKAAASKVPDRGKQKKHKPTKPVTRLPSSSEDEAEQEVAAAEPFYAEPPDNPLRHITRFDVAQRSSTEAVASKDIFPADKTANGVDDAATAGQHKQPAPPEGVQGGTERGLDGGYWGSDDSFGALSAEDRRHARRCRASVPPLTGA